MKNVHLLEAKQPCRLHYYNHLDNLGLSKENLQWKQGRNIYITSDEEIKEGDWFYCPTTNIVNQCESDYHSKKLVEPKRFKIILTTDTDLIKEGVQEIPDDFLEWFCKNSWCENVGIERSYSMSQSSYSGIEYEITMTCCGAFYGCDKCKVKPFKHECKVIPAEEILTNRSNAYEFIDKETFDQYLQRLKDRRTEDNYKYTDEDFKNYIHHIFDCYEKNISVYKCLEFMYFMEREIKLEDIFNDEKKEGLKQFILDHKKSLLINEEDLREAFLQGWMIRERFDDLSPDIIYPAGLDYEEKQHYAFTLWFDKFKNK